MDLLLKLLGGITLLVITVLGGGILYLRWKFGSAIKLLGKNIPQPATVSLIPNESPDWIRSPKVAADIKELVALGFTSGVVYSIPEMPGVEVLSLRNTSLGVDACY